MNEQERVELERLRQLQARLLSLPVPPIISPAATRQTTAPGAPASLPASSEHAGRDAGAPRALFRHSDFGNARILKQALAHFTSSTVTSLTSRSTCSRVTSPASIVRALAAPAALPQRHASPKSSARNSRQTKAA